MTGNQGFRVDPRGLCLVKTLADRRIKSGCTTYKWKLGCPAFPPIVFKLAIQMAAAESQDRRRSPEVNFERFPADLWSTPI